MPAKQSTAEIGITANGYGESLKAAMQYNDCGGTIKQPYLSLANGGWLYRRKPQWLSYRSLSFVTGWLYRQKTDWQPGWPCTAAGQPF